MLEFIAKNGHWIIYVCSFSILWLSRRNFKYIAKKEIELEKREAALIHVLEVLRDDSEREISNLLLGIDDPILKIVE